MLRSGHSARFEVVVFYKGPPGHPLKLQFRQPVATKELALRAGRKALRLHGTRAGFSKIVVWDLHKRKMLYVQPDSNPRGPDSRRFPEYVMILEFTNGRVETHPIFAGKRSTVKVARSLWAMRKENKLTSITIADPRSNQVVWNMPESNPPRNLMVVKMTDGSYWVVIFAGHKILRLVAGPFPNESDARTVMRQLKHELKEELRFPYHDNPARRRMGRLIEVRYQRDHGKHKGFYRHQFSSPVDVYANEESIFAKGV